MVGGVRSRSSLVWVLALVSLDSDMCDLPPLLLRGCLHSCRPFTVCWQRLLFLKAFACGQACENQSEVDEAVARPTFVVPFPYSGSPLFTKLLCFIQLSLRSVQVYTGVVTPLVDSARLRLPTFASCARVVQTCPTDLTHGTSSGGHGVPTSKLSRLLSKLTGRILCSPRYKKNGVQNLSFAYADAETPLIKKIRNHHHQKSDVCLAVQ